MRPILYEQNERVFDTNGMGILHDAISAEVTEVRNSEFELELKYPVGGEWANALTQNRYILVKPNDYDEPHAFRIYEVEKEVDSNQITVKAVTKTDELSGNIIKPLSIKSATPSGAWEQLKRVAVDPIEYNFISDIQTAKDTKMDIRNVLNAIAGEEGSFIDTWGGEIKRTNNTIFLYSKRGKDHVTTIRPRKNLKNVKVKSSMAGKFTRILPYATFTPEGEGEAEQVIYGDIIKSPHYDDYFVKRIVPLDLSSEFNNSDTPAKEGEKKKAPTPAQVTAKAQSYFTSKNKDADKPDLSVEVEMIPLQDSTEWDRRIIQALEKIQLCDTVDVYVPKIDCDVTVKVRKIVYDALRERIIKIEASSSGSGRASLADQQKAQWQDLTNKVINNALYGEKDGLIHTILTSANNKNKNFYGPEEPPREKVSKDDLWFKPVGGEGEVEMWRFDGEQWVLVIDANFGQKVTDKVNAAIDSVKQDINTNVQESISAALADAEKRWRPDLTPIQNELDAKLRKLDDDINVKVTDIKDNIEKEIGSLSITNPNLLVGTVDMSTIPENISIDDNNWRRVDGIGGTYQRFTLGGYRYVGTNEQDDYKKSLLGIYRPGYLKKGKYVWSFYVKTDTPGFVLKTYCNPKVNKIHDIKIDDVSVGTFSNNEYSFRLQDTDEHIISYYFEVVDESQCFFLGLLRTEQDTVGATLDTYKWKIEEGGKRTPWCPNILDTSPEWATYKQTNESNLAELNRRVTQTNGETEVLKTRIEQTSNEIKIAAKSLEAKVDGNATNTAAELRVIKDSISAKVSQTDLDVVSGRVTSVETNLTTRIDGIQTSVDKVTRDVDGKISSAVSSAITQSEKELGLRITATEAKILLEEIPELDKSVRAYTDTKFNLVDGKIQTQIDSRLTDYARTTDVATRVTQEAGRIKTELTSVIENKIPKKYGSRNFLAGTKTEIHFNGPIKKQQDNNAWEVISGYWFIDKKTLKERGYKVGDRMNIQFKTRTTTPGITSMRVSPEVYSGGGYLQWINGSNPFGLPREYNKDEWDVSTSDTYKTKIGWFNISENSLNNGMRIRFRIDVAGEAAGTNVAIDIKDAMMWDGDLWTDYAPAYEDIDLDSSEKFQEVLQTVDVYKRTLGSTQNGITTSISQLIQSSDEIKSVITNAAESSTNLIMDTDSFASARFNGFSNGVDGYTASAVPGLYGSNEFFYLSKIKIGQASNNQAFVSLPLAIDKMSSGDFYTFSCRYKLDTTNAFRSDKPITAELQILDKVGSPVYLKSLTVNPGNVVEANLTETFQVDRDRYFDNVNGFGATGRLAFRIKLIGDGRIGTREIMLVKGKTVGPYKPAGGVSSTVVTQRANAWALNLTGPKDVITSINADTSGVRLKGKNIVLDGDVIANGRAFIKESWIEDLNASKITAGELNAARVKVINMDASNIVSGTMSASRVRGGELRALNDTTVFDLQSGTLNLYSDTGTIRRIDETSSSQFFKMTRSGFVAERFRDNKAAMIVLGTNHDKSESTNNETFSGIRLWSGTGNGHNEDLFEVVSDRIIFYANGRYRSPWVLHNNTQDGNTFLIPMNEKGVKHYLGRGDKHFMGIYTDNLYLGAEAHNAGGYLWDLLTCFGVIKKYGWDLKSKAIQKHIGDVLTKYNFR